MHLGIALATALALQQASPEAGPPGARSHTIVGELVRVDVGRRSVTVKEVASGRAREYELEIVTATRISSGGRVARLEELRPGERVLATCSDPETGRHRAVLLKVGPSRYAAPDPRPAKP